MKKKSSLFEKLPELLLQVVLITLAVFLGLIANDWNESIKTERLKEQSLKMLSEEVSINKEKISKAYEYHKMLIDSITEYSKKDVSSITTLSFWQGLQTPILSESAYNSLLSTGIITSFDLNELHLINKVYTFHKHYEKATTISLQTLVQMDFYDKSKLKSILFKTLMLLNDLYYAEKELLRMYDIYKDHFISPKGTHEKR